jgi:uncharacterized protein YycO
LTGCKKKRNFSSVVSGGEVTTEASCLKPEKNKNRGGEMRIIVKGINFLLCIFILLFSASLAYAEGAEDPQKFIEDYQKLIESTPGMQELIDWRDSHSISMEELFKSGQMDITWEEFVNLPRRMQTEDEIAAIKQQAESGEEVYADQFGEPSGENNFDYSTALMGDILLVHDGACAWGYYRHAGMWNKDRDEADRPPIAESRPSTGVHYAPWNDFNRHYDVQAGFKPQQGWGYVAYRAMLNAADHIGKPYSYDFWNKYRTDKFYCSSLVWRAYYDAGTYFGMLFDIDSNGGDAVFPDDISYSTNLHVWQIAY